MKNFLTSFILYLTVGALSAQAMNQSEKIDFKTNLHPRVLTTSENRDAILHKIDSVDWAKKLVDNLHASIDPILAIHNENPSYVPSRLQMHWAEGKRYTNFRTEGNLIPHRSGNAKYPTLRVPYARAASNSAPLVPLDKIIPYSDGTLLKPHNKDVKYNNPMLSGEDVLIDFGHSLPYDTLTFENTGLGVETINRALVHVAWKSAVLYYLTQNKDYAKLTADIIWPIVRGAAQQSWINPDQQGGINGYLSFETLGDSRHFATLPLAYDMIYDYLHDVYFDLPQFKEGIPDELWAPAHSEDKEWALRQFEIMFKSLIENKLQRGGGLEGNWNMNEQQSAILYALALDDDKCYDDGRGRGYYVNALINGPTTETHGAYKDVLRANISPTTGLWPEAPSGYGQGSMAMLIRFGFIYFLNGIDLLSEDPLLKRLPDATVQMLFPNGYVTNIGDATYGKLQSEPIELMMSYANTKGDLESLDYYANMMQYTAGRKYDDELMLGLFAYMPNIPAIAEPKPLSRTSASEVYSMVFGRLNADNPVDAMAFTLTGFGSKMGHRQPNGLTMELYGRGHVFAPDQGIGADYWSADTHDYKINIAGHNTVSPNGEGADNNMPQQIEVLYAEPAISEGQYVPDGVSANHQMVDVTNRFLTNAIDANQRRLLAMVRDDDMSGYFIDVFRSACADSTDRYHDYIYHNMGIDAIMTKMDGTAISTSCIPLDSLSGKGYSYFKTLASADTGDALIVDFHLGTDDMHTRMFIPKNSYSESFLLSSPACHRYYLPELKAEPVPAVLLRKRNAAWDNPFVTIYEPYGNGIDAKIKEVNLIEGLENEAIGIEVKFLNSDRKDIILYGQTPNDHISYCGIEFEGLFSVASFLNDSPIKIYISNGKKWTFDNLNINCENGSKFWCKCNK